MKAMILAAGRGERLKPLTNTTPKALVEVQGQPLIVHHLFNLKHSGICDIIINLAYLGEKIEAALGNGHQFGVNIDYSREPHGRLETGGGIVNALPLLGDAPFITVNADIFCDFDFSKLITTPVDQAHLVLVENPNHNQNGDYGLQEGQLIYPFARPGLTYSGIAKYHPQFFDGCSRERCSVTPLVRQAANNNIITAEKHDGAWFDVGTPERLEQAQNS